MYNRYFKSFSPTAWRATVALTIASPYVLHSQFSYSEKEADEEEKKGGPINSPSFPATTNNRSRSHDREEMRTLSSMILISGSAHRELTQEIADNIKVPIANVQCGRFMDGEVSVVINEHLRGKHVFIVQPCAAPVNDSIMELLLTISCARRSGASNITAVIPYFGYKHHRRGSSMSTMNHSRFLNSGAMDFAKMLQEMGVDSVIAVDLQRPGQGHEACFFDTHVPLETIVTTSVFVDYFTNKQPLENPIVVVAPNAECIKKAKRLQRGLQKRYTQPVKLAAYIAAESTNSGPTDTTKLELLGGTGVATDFFGADVVIVDDIIDSGGTLAELSQRLHKAGAKNIYLCASHGLFAEKTIANIDASAVKKIVVTNSLPRPIGKFHSTKVHQVSIAPMLSRIILSEHFSGCYDDVITEEVNDEDKMEDEENITQG
jgi:ribose-phosphate pyrophosphokinase